MESYMKTIKISIIATGLAFSMSIANSLSKSCIEEFAKLPATKADFNIEAFLKELPAEVVKVKAQLKLPFGKPADSKKTDIGITVGCLKQFPESTGAIAPMLKDLSIEMAKNQVGSKLGVVGNAKPGNQNSSEKKVAVNKDIIFLRNGQEIRDAAVAEIGIDEVKYRIGTRTVAYVVKKSDISIILYADGTKDSFCNSISYNSTTHFCHTDGKIYSCKNKPYNPATQSCYNDNQILNKCSGNDYNPDTHFCHTDGKIYSCGDKPYNPATQLCHSFINYQILRKCEEVYNPATHFCHTDGQLYSCGNKPYNPATHSCSDNTIIGDKFSCEGKPYNPGMHFCHTDGQLYSCGDKPYNPATHTCEWSNIFIRK